MVQSIVLPVFVFPIVIFMFMMNGFIRIGLPLLMKLALPQIASPGVETIRMVIFVVSGICSLLFIHTPQCIASSLLFCLLFIV